MSAPFGTIAIVGLGLIGSSIARAVRQALPETRILGYDRSADVCARAEAIGLCDGYHAVFGPELASAEMVILCVPVGAMGQVAREIAPALKPDALVSDVGSTKQSIAAALAEALPDHTVIPAHPVAGTEHTGPDAGFATLFHHRWCILTPPPGADPDLVARLAEFWRALGSTVEVMDDEHHDLVLAVTSHIPHLIAYTIVGTASDLEDVTRGEVIKYSAGGFRDFTRIAASDPTMWRDVFLHNREAVLEMLGKLTDDLAGMRRAIEAGDGDALFDRFTRTRAIRRSIIEEGQDDARPDFGRKHNGD